jgi:hypothetical protein
MSSEYNTTKYIFPKESNNMNANNINNGDNNNKINTNILRWLKL